MTNDEASALIEAGRKRLESIHVEMPECMCCGDAVCSSWCPRASWSDIADSAESWMRTNFSALLDGYSAALDAAASWESAAMLLRSEAIATLETSNEYHRRHLEAMAENDRLRASNETLVRHRQVTQDQLDKFMSACADQTIQIMELRGETVRLRTENAYLNIECNDAADIKAELHILRGFVRAIPDAELTRDKIHRDDVPELFTDSDGTALYLVEAKRRILEFKP